MIENKINFRTVLLIGSFFLLLLAPLQVNAEEMLDFNNGLNEAKLTEEKTVSVHNGSTHSTITIQENGKEIYSKELTAIKVSAIEKILVDGHSYAIILYRFNGSSSALYFEVLELNYNSVENIYTSNVYNLARINVEANQIMVKYPEFNEGDSKTTPSTIVSQTFLVKDKVIKGDKVAESVESTSLNENKSRIFSVNTENPPYAEISKILTEEAIKAGIPPEILKAIAYQESDWRQYWNTVPEYVKSCEIYDGSNVVIGYDCIGIGIMQISDYRFMDDGAAKEEYIHKLKTDIRFNIQEGIKTLKRKWNYGGPITPTVNNNDPMVIENWYFAILAYNGLSPINNPLTNPFTAYQEDVFQRIENYSLIDLNPFPTHKLDPYETESGQLRFRNENVEVLGPQHLTHQSFSVGDVSYVTVNGLNLRDAPAGTSIGTLSKGTKVTVTGSYTADGSRTNHFVWYPIRTESGNTGWVASSYLSPTSKYLDVYELQGFSRYLTSVSISNHGWHWQQPEAVVLGRGDVPIDALTGSVLASALDSPLLLTNKNELTDAVEKEIDRLKPNQIYILGGEEFAISQRVETELKEKFGEGNVIRVEGETREGTAYQVAKEVSKLTAPNEIFITTRDETSSDPLAIAPYAGENGIPILLTGKNTLNEKVKQYINEYGIKKATIIGGETAISPNVETELSTMIGAGNVERVAGFTRFNTNTEIIETFYNTGSVNNVFVAQAYESADALSATSLASKLGAPILLTKTDRVPSETNSWINSNITAKPDIYFLGGPVAIAESTRNKFVEVIK